MQANCGLTIPWGNVCQQKQLLTDVVAGGVGLRSVLPTTALTPGRWPPRNLSTHPILLIPVGEGREPSRLSHRAERLPLRPQESRALLNGQSWFSCGQI